MTWERNRDLHARYFVCAGYQRETMRAAAILLRRALIDAGLDRILSEGSDT